MFVHHIGVKPGAPSADVLLPERAPCDASPVADGESAPVDVPTYGPELIELKRFGDELLRLRGVCGSEEKISD